MTALELIVLILRWKRRRHGAVALEARAVLLPEERNRLPKLSQQALHFRRGQPRLSGRRTPHCTNAAIRQRRRPAALLHAAGRTGRIDAHCSARSSRRRLAAAVELAQAWHNQPPGAFLGLARLRFAVGRLARRLDVAAAHPLLLLATLRLGGRQRLALLALALQLQAERFHGLVLAWHRGRYRRGGGVRRRVWGISHCCRESSSLFFLTYHSAVCPRAQPCPVSLDISSVNCELLP